MKALVIAPHPDDEVLGVGGTIHRFASEGQDVVVAIVTRGWAPLFSDEQVARVREESQAACGSLGVRDLRFLDLPVTKLKDLPEAELNQALTDLIQDVEPDWLFIPFPGDRHEDHRQVFDACMVAARPTCRDNPIRMVLSYETVSETHWTATDVEPVFSPNYYIGIGDHLQAKCDAMRCYASQLLPAPHARSIEAITALATWRGSVVGLAAAEAFMLVRGVHAP
jgi:N-acetylglucosamine malate deacetylase 1